jgi:hypothetical protein
VYEHCDVIEYVMAIGNFMGCSSIVADITNSEQRPDSRLGFKAMHNSCLQALGCDCDRLVVF